MSSAGQAASVLALPAPVLALCLNHLTDSFDLARACCVCRAFRDAGSSNPLWHTFCQQWMHWNDDLYAQLKAERNFKAIYALKLQADERAWAALDSLVFPHKRAAGIRELKKLGGDAQDVIDVDLGACGSMDMGRRLWAKYAAIRCNVAACAKRLGGLLQHQEPDVLQASLMIASALDPGEAAIATVPGRVSQLGAELRRRIDAVAAGDNLEGLELLKRLLFGRRPGGFTPEDTLPPARAGLQLRSRDDDTLEGDDLLLHKVFKTGLGTSVSLSVIAVAVGRAAGLSMQHVDLPGHFMSRLAPSNTSPVHYLDASSGSILDREDMQRICAALGVPPALSDAPTSAAKVLECMCTNLLKCMEHKQHVSTMRTVLELLCTIEPDSAGWCFPLAQMCLLTGDLDACCAELQRAQQKDWHGHGSPETDARIRALAERAQSEKRRLLEKAAVRRRRSQFPGVMYRVGDVIQLRGMSGHTGVIRGWDETCKAPDHVCQAMHVDQRPGGRNQPFYHVIIDEASSRFSQPHPATYQAQEGIEVVTRQEDESDNSFLVQSRRIGEFFDGIQLGGSRYVPNAYLRMLYPEDEDIGDALESMQIAAR